MLSDQFRLLSITCISLGSSFVNVVRDTIETMEVKIDNALVSGGDECAVSNDLKEY